MDLRFPNSAANLDPADSCCGALTISNLSQKCVAAQRFLSGFRWTQILLNSVDFQMSYKTQNPPLATAYRFESGHRHQEKERSFCFSLFSLCWRQTRTRLNATPRWGVAHLRLDEGDTFIFFEEENVSQVRSPAPKKQIPEPGICFFAS